MAYNKLNQSELFERINQLLSENPARPPFTLIIGSGFSYGIIPTTSQVVRENLSWWKWCQRREPSGPTPDDFVQRNEKDLRFTGRAKDVAKEFWARVHRAQPASLSSKFTLDTDGLPANETLGHAYRFVLSSACTPGLNTPQEVRRYFGDMIRRAGRRLNPAHLFLAALIAEKPRLFGTIFTTNFDPLLQRSLQLVNTPYFVSDRPETLQYPDDDDIADAVHVIHAHGSIYRYLLLNSPDEIEAFADVNKHKLQEYFRKHAVLIVGFSGWDDAITRALTSVDRFDQNLYWCDRSPDLDTSSLTPDARGILKKHANAFYVPIHSADELMAQMHQHLLGHALPKVFREPILSSRDQLEMCDLTGVKLPRTPVPSTAVSTDEATTGSSSAAEELDLGKEVDAVRKRLDEAQDLFTGKTSTDPTSILAAHVRQRFAAASDLYFSGKYVEALPDLDFVVANANVLDPADWALAMFRRGFAFGRRGREGDADSAISDYTAVIDMPDAPAEQRAMARFNRGVVYGRRGREGDADRAIADYTAVIDMPDAPVEQRAKARVNRGFVYGRRGQEGDADRAIADYTAMIDMPDAPAEPRGRALNNRGFAYGRRGQEGDADRAIADYTAVINMPDAPRRATGGGAC